jgi:peptidoglycan/LPS O-acetylase OafA/YrhL
VCQSDTVEEHAFVRRKSLDGLRGIFTLQVVFYHTKIPWFSQGYVGIDSFYVVSGFVITSVVIHEVFLSMSFEFLRFYGRRIKRLLLASLLVLIITAIVFHKIAGDARVNQHKGSFVTAAIYCENFYLMWQSSDDLLSTQLKESPVMHYWALSLEEQFYCLWPMSILLLAKLCGFNISKLIIICLVPIAVLVGSLIYTSSFGVEMYYSLQWHFYQLLLGGILAMLAFRYHKEERIPQTHLYGTISAIGLLGNLIISTDFVQSSMIISGLLATIFTAMVVMGNELSPASWTCTILERYAFQWLGKYSYMVYLWHYPVIIVVPILARIEYPEILLLGLILLLAFLTHELNTILVQKAWVNTWSNRTIVLVGLTGAITTAILLAILYGSAVPVQPVIPALEVMPTKSDKSDVELVSSTISTLPSSSPSPLPSSYTSLNSTTGKNWRSLREGDLVVLYGDSFAREWATLTADLAQEHKLRYSSYFELGCPWIKGLVYVDPIDYSVKESCNELPEFESLILRDTVKVFILDIYSILVILLQEPGINSGEPNRLIYPGEPGWIEIVEEYARKTLKNLFNTSLYVIFIEPHPVPKPFDINACASINLEDANSACSVPAQLDAGGVEWIALLRKLASESENFVVVSFDDVVCPNQVCSPFVDDSPQFADTTHLSKHTTVRLSKIFEQRVFINNKLWK